MGGVIYAWGLAGGLAAVVMEVVYLRHQGSFVRLLPLVFTFNTIISYSVFRLVKESGNLVHAVLVFSLCTLSTRVVFTLLNGQEITRGTWVAIGLLLLAQLAKRYL